MRRTPLRQLTFLTVATFAAVAASSTDINIVVDATHPVGKCDNFLWANIGFDPLYAEITSEDARPVLRMIRESRAFRFIRCHNYFSDGLPRGRGQTYFGCRIYREDANGKVSYEWWYLDEVLDRILASGLRPIVECDFMPDALAEGKPLRNYGGGLINTPKDYLKWRDLVYATVRHCIERYGAQEVRQWRWEIWNEPDLYRYFIDGLGYQRPRKFTPSMVERLNKMYDYFVDGAVAADARIKVGGPGLAGNIQYLRAFLEHVTNGTNYATGRRGTRIDLISWHGYGRTPALLAKNRRFLDMIRRDFPSLASAEVQQNEWGRPLRVRGRRPSPDLSYKEFEAAFLCRYVDAMYSVKDSSVDMFLKWGRLTMKRRGAWRPLTRYFGDRPLPTPIFHAYVLLGKLGPERLPVKQPDWPSSVRAIAARTADGTAQVLVYHFDELNEDSRSEPLAVNLTVEGVKRRGPVRLYRIDRHHSNFFREWESLGRPRFPADDLLRRIQKASQLAVSGISPTTVTSSALTFNIEMPVNSVVLLTINGENRREWQPPAHIRRVLRADDELERARQLAKDGDLKNAIKALLSLAGDYKDLYVSQCALRDLVRLYETELNQPEQADKYRAELLKTTLGDDERLRLLEARLAFLEKRGIDGEVKKIRSEIQKVRPKVARRGPWAP